jgi:hypothetical protein
MAINAAHERGTDIWPENKTLSSVEIPDTNNGTE